MKVNQRYRIFFGWRLFISPYSHFKFVRKLIGGKWELWKSEWFNGFNIWLPVCHFDLELGLGLIERLDTEEY